jgi:hypothetical protein
MLTFILLNEFVDVVATNGSMRAEARASQNIDARFC